MLHKLFAVLVVLFALALWPTAAQGAIINYNFSIDGAQANAGLGTGSPGIGTGIVSLDTGTNLLTWNISYTGLTGTVTAAHFHGPALPSQNAGVQVSIGTSNPAMSKAYISVWPANDLLAGLWYVNVHSTTFPGGEIRGQVVPEPSALFLIGLGSTMLIRRRQRKNG